MVQVGRGGSSVREKTWGGLVTSSFKCSDHIARPALCKEDVKRVVFIFIRARIAISEGFESTETMFRIESIQSFGLTA